MILRKFLAASGMRKSDIFRHYSKWSDVLRDAGLKVGPRKLDATALLTDWGNVARKIGRRPTLGHYRLHGKYNSHSLLRRFGRWRGVPEAFREFAGDQREWADVVGLIAGSKPPAMTGGKRKCPARNPVRRLPDRPVCGIPLDFGALRHAPATEDGVIFLFGILAEKLGFMVEAFQRAFPDCQAKRWLGAEGLQHVRIEFEYESRNFRVHCHPPEGCDIIVCWRHNWPDCPKNIEVIALSDEIKRLSPGGTTRK